MSTFRIPLVLLGLVSYFSANRYFSAFDYYLPLVLFGYTLIVVSLVLSLLSRKQAKQQAYDGEVRSWNHVII